MAASPSVVRRRRRESRPKGLRIGRRGWVTLIRNGVRVKSQAEVAAAFSRQV